MEGGLEFSGFLWVASPLSLRSVGFQTFDEWHNSAMSALKRQNVDSFGSAKEITRADHGESSLGTRFANSRRGYRCPGSLLSVRSHRPETGYSPGPTMACRHGRPSSRRMELGVSTKKLAKPARSPHSFECRPLRILTTLQ